MESLKQDEKTILSPEEYIQRHKLAFRCAFDFLNEHFPPGEDAEWWLKATRELKAASIEHGEDRLLNGLLLGVFEYIYDEYEIRRKANGKSEG